MCSQRYGFSSLLSPHESTLSQTCPMETWRPFLQRNPLPDAHREGKATIKKKNKDNDKDDDDQGEGQIAGIRIFVKECTVGYFFKSFLSVIHPKCSIIIIIIILSFIYFVRDKEAWSWSALESRVYVDGCCDRGTMPWFFWISSLIQYFPVASATFMCLANKVKSRVLKGFD